MDDERIRQLTEEVLAAVRDAPAERESAASIEGRLAALEAAVRRLEATRGSETPAAVATAIVSVASTPQPRAAALPSAVRHPSLRLLDVPGGDDRCILEPDQPCEKSGRCRTLGY
jgi:hypothetical protein